MKTTMAWRTVQCETVDNVDIAQEIDNDRGVRRDSASFESDPQPWHASLPAVWDFHSALVSSDTFPRAMTI